MQLPVFDSLGHLFVCVGAAASEQNSVVLCCVGLHVCCAHSRGATLRCYKSGKVVAQKSIGGGREVPPPLPSTPPPPPTAPPPETQNRGTSPPGPTGVSMGALKRVLVGSVGALGLNFIDLEGIEPSIWRGGSCKQQSCLSQQTSNSKILHRFVSLQK